MRIFRSYLQGIGGKNICRYVSQDHSSRVNGAAAGSPSHVPWDMAQATCHILNLVRGWRARGDPD